MDLFFGLLPVVAVAALVAVAWLMNRRKSVFLAINDWFRLVQANRKVRRVLRAGGLGAAVYNTQNLRVERLYFTGGQTLQAGQPLVFQSNPATSASTKGFPFDVRLPDTNNVNAFIGIVHPNSVGFTGPGPIDVIIPQRGDILQVLCASTNSDQAVGYPLQLKADFPTASSTSTSGSGNGAFVVADIFTMTVASTTTWRGSVIMNQFYQVKGRLLESIASVAATSDGARSLKWAQVT